jgi:photosystem II stability/assembly factor-like uncharacterized protein
MKLSNFRFNTLCFWGLLLLASACVKEKPVTATFEELQLPTTLAITSIVAENDSVLWVAAGQRFGRGAVFKTSDAGQNWQQILDSDQEITDLELKNGKLYALPIGNQILWTSDNGQNWQNIFMPGWEYFSAAAIFDNDFALLVGGENFGKGIVHQLSTNTNTFLWADTLQHNLRDIFCLNDSVVFAVGYGVILRSADRGLNWVPDAARGDYYKAICFPDSLNGYVAGDYGSIYKTTDAGLNWTKIKKGSSFFNEKTRFSDIHFSDADAGAVVGVDGLLWQTKNAGDSWIPIENLPKTNFRAIFTGKTKIFVGAENGRLITVEKL